MSKAIGAVLAAVLLAGLHAAAAGSEAPSRIEIASDPPGYDAWVNDRYAGRTPTAVDVAPGRNVLVIARSASDSLFSSPAADTLLDVAEGETLRVLIPLGRPVTILSHPFGIVVARDGAIVGRTPLQLRISPSTLPRLELVTSGGRIPVPADSLVAMGIWMYRGPETTAPVPADGRSLLRKVARYALPGFAAVCIGSGAVMERGADRAYDRYLRSGDPEAIRRNYDAARRRDRWSTVLWSTGEISLAASILSWIIPADGAGR